MLKRYRLYRSYKHPRWVAIVLAPDPVVFPIISIVTGALFTFVLVRYS
jgi:hypothetical protein